MKKQDKLVKGVFRAPIRSHLLSHFIFAVEHHFVAMTTHLIQLKCYEFQNKTRVIVI